MKIPVVDRDDTVIGLKERDDLTKGDISRVSALWITNSKGEYLLAQRALTKRHSPGKWGPAVAGTVEEGETYEINIIKETQEEIGITLSVQELLSGPKVLRKPGTGYYFVQWYFAVVDKDLSGFTYPENEVTGLRWVSDHELRTNLAGHGDEYIASLHESLELLVKGAEEARRHFIQK
ncbi:MAG: putative NTP pyrophosphohydrolase [Parcubacteria bacterium C7867-004]|nr:MAG: putative NTP pyrophosphohydrolase [Parcubacteria bacterium C7867-004]